MYSACSDDHPVLHSFPTRRSSDLGHLRDGVGTAQGAGALEHLGEGDRPGLGHVRREQRGSEREQCEEGELDEHRSILRGWLDRKSTRLNSSHPSISYAVFCLKKKK